MSSDLDLTATVFVSSLGSSSASLASVNGRLQTNYNNNITHKWHFGKLLRCDLCAITKLRQSEIKQNMSGRSVHLYYTLVYKLD